MMRSTGKAILVGLALIWLVAQISTIVLHQSRMNREDHRSSARELLVTQRSANAPEKFVLESSPAVKVHTGCADGASGDQDHKSSGRFTTIGVGVLRTTTHSNG